MLGSTGPETPQKQRDTKLGRWKPQPYQVAQVYVDPWEQPFTVNGTLTKQASGSA